MPEQVIDFSDCRINNASNYGGSDRKFGIIYNGEPYMIKFAEKGIRKNVFATSHVNNCISEFIGSRIAQSVGLPTHDTILGYYKDEFVVACKDFCSRNQVILEFANYMRMKYDSADIGKLPKLEQIYDIIQSVPALDFIKEEAIRRYWDTFVVDALTANFDRHKGNWGYLADRNTGEVSVAPTYDYGSTLYPSISDDGIKEILDNPKEIAERIFVFPNAALLVNGVKADYYHMLSSGYDKNCVDAVARIVPRINMDKLNSIVEQTPLISNERKTFYKNMLFFRKKLILEIAYDCVKSKEFDKKSFERLRLGLQYSKKDFFIDWDMGYYKQIENYMKEHVKYEFSTIDMSEKKKESMGNEQGRRR